MGVWLPLAMADVVMMLLAVSHRAAGDTGELHLPKRSEIVDGWALPIMAAALREDEEEQEAFKLLNSVRNLGKK